jgi:hypothetical protein
VLDRPETAVRHAAPPAGPPRCSTATTQLRAHVIRSRTGAPAPLPAVGQAAGRMHQAAMRRDLYWMMPGKALLHCGDPGHAGASTSPIRWSWPVRRMRPPPAGSRAPRPPARNVHAERSAPTHAPRRPPWRCDPVEAPHRSQPCLQSAVISLNPVVAILLSVVPRRRQQRV